MNWRLFDRRFSQSLSTHHGSPTSGVSLDTKLVRFSSDPDDVWTLRDACNGTQIFGSVGSGKTSGSGSTLARSLLQSGCGFLVLTAKIDEFANWGAHCAATGRSHSLLRFDASGKYRFNFMDYTLKTHDDTKSLTETLVNLFMACARVGDSGSSENHTDAKQEFFDKAAKQLLRNTIDLVSLATGTISLPMIYDAITTAPVSAEQLESDNPDSFWSHCMKEAEAKAGRGEFSPSQVRDLNMTLKYWYNEYAALAEETRSSIVVTFSSLADMFLRGLLADLLSSDSNFFPCEFSQAGMCVVLDLPVHKFKQAGLLAQVVLLLVWISRMQQRLIYPNTRPCVLWIDESQYFLVKELWSFLTSSRSYKICPVLISQNVSNYYTVFGNKGRETADALLALLGTKIFHSSNDAVTNQGRK